MTIMARKEEPRFFKIQTHAHPEEAYLEANASIQFVLGLLVTQLLISKLPHNLVFTEDVQTVYVYPRSKQRPYLGWIDLCGWSRFKEADMRKSHWVDTSVDLATFEQLCSNLKDVIQGQFI